MGRVFVSYSRKDFDEVQSLINKVKELVPMMDFWFDVDDIESGDEFEDKIVEAIEQSSCVIFALSDNSLKSSWTKDEIVFARNSNKKVIPILLKGAKLSGWFLFKFGRVDCIDSTDVIQINKLAKNLSMRIVRDENAVEEVEQPKVKVENPEQYITDSSVYKNRDFLVAGVSFTMVAVKGGMFKMGINADEGAHDMYDDSSPCHEVTLSDYYIGETLVTQKLFVAVMGYNPSLFADKFKHAGQLGLLYKRKKSVSEFDTEAFASDLDRPVDSVSYNECVEFIKRLNKLTGENFKLPTEAQWEYAARGAANSRGFVYSGSNDVSEVAWFNNNSDNSTQNVKSKKPNEIGCFDMTGNVCEWCADYYAPYSSESVKNPLVKLGAIKVLRGGSWLSPEKNCSVFVRFGGTAGFKDAAYGFRLAL